jgi:predicted O-linked N-acetylglucosamine transferase (SPINDLY family)
MNSKEGRALRMEGRDRFDLAISLLQAQDFAGAEKNLLKVLKKQPGHVGALNTLAILLAQSGRHAQAEQYFLNAIQVFPFSDATYYNYGITLRALGRLAEARDAFDKSLAINPSSSDAWNNRGVISSNLGDFRSAIADFDKAILANPRNAAAYANKGKALAQLELGEEARAAYARAIAISPNLSEAWLGLGQVLSQLRRHNDALPAYERAISLKPDLPEAWSGRGQALMAFKHYEEAYATYDYAMKLMPELDYVPGKWLHARMHCCLWDDIDNAYKRVLNEVSGRKKAASPFNLLSIPSTASEQKIAAETYTADNFPPLAEQPEASSVTHRGKIRIGYFSADFREHAVAYLMARLFELHDRSKFEIFGFSLGPSADDEMRGRLTAGFDQLIEANNKSDEEIADSAKNLQIDIAIDLMGFTEGSRTGIFAHRAAPIQVNYLGFPGTMGAKYMDYIIADRILVRPEDADFYSEKIAYLPHTYQVNDNTRRISDRRFTRDELGLPADAFVFCCFNNSFKITPDVFDIWMRLLTKVDGSILWLPQSNGAAVKSLRAEAIRRRIAGDRIVFAERVEQLSDHLARLPAADLFLDTFYYNAHTTASDALWTGLPVVTRLGDTFASRVAASLLNAIGLPELVTHTSDEYEQLAFQLASDRDKLSLIRKRLADNRLTHPLFDTELFTRHIESAYEKMWERHCMNLKPDHVFVEAS